MSNTDDPKNEISTRRQKTGLILTIVFCALFLLVDYFCIWFYFLRVVPKHRSYFSELGSEDVSTDPDDYLTGISFLHKRYGVDASKVDPYREGSYEVIVSNGKKQYMYYVNIVDTTAPRVDISNGISFLVNPDSYEEKNGEAQEERLYELSYPYSADFIFDYLYDESGSADISVFIGEALMGEISLDTPAGFSGENKGTFYERFREEAESSEFRFCFQETGDYPVTVTVTDGSGNTTRKDFTASVRDSTAPVIVPYPDEDAPYFATGHLYGAEDFASYIEDNSGFFSTAIIEGGETLARTIVDTPGDHTVTLYAVDEAGNEVTEDITVKFDEPPIFIAVRDKVVQKDSDYDLAKHIIAVDKTDGDVSDTIEIYDDGFDTSVPGVYNVRYTAHDSYGLETEIIAKLTVGSNRTPGFYLREDEISLLCDYSYFEYEPLDNYDFDEAVELVEPTLVNIMQRFGNNGYNAGSGFIYAINDDYTYIVTCWHVTKNMYGRIEIMFCDEESSTVYVDMPEVTEYAPDNEIAMFRIPTSDIPAEVLVDLKEVYCDEDIYSELRKGDEIIAYSGHWLNDEPLIRPLIVRDLDSSFIEDAMHCVRTSHNVESGMSGTAVVDKRGRLVGIVEGFISYWDYTKADYTYDGYQLRIDGLSELYQRVSGE